MTRQPPSDQALEYRFAHHPPPDDATALGPMDQRPV